MNDSALSLLGLCRKAGKLSLGHDACKASLNAGNASLCVICSDASERLNEEITALAEKAEVRIVDVSYTMLDIKNAVSFKAAVFTVDDEGFAKTLINKFNDNESGKERGL
ncbi:MAG: ribosomal L7Ae/L30e/S12e/Gadd45 family protein [Clostridia bacterium]|nr:ribosomal L7Ae/L30e/S12e/Gadd45 family protein [Clostridia bacterium]